MDAFTHGLASYALNRAAFPRASRSTLLAVVLAGSAADLDQLSRASSAATFLEWNRTATHSLAGTLAITIAFSAAAWLATRRKPNADTFVTIFAAVLAACSLHLAMDLTQNESVELLWPFRARRFAADAVARFDLWILLLLLAGALLPQLLALVTEEIGAKSKGPRGRVGAILALLAVCAYVAARVILHGNAVTLLDARTYRGESPRRVGAFAESDSPLHWHGVVETERAFYDFDLSLGPRASFNPDAAVALYKPESSPALEAAQQSGAFRQFLPSARFPKATVEKTATGYRIIVRDLAQRRDAPTAPRVIAVVETDASARILNDELQWDEKR